MDQWTDKVLPQKSCIEKSIPSAGCTGSAAEIAACACKPETQAKLVSPVTQCAMQNKCDVSALAKAQSIAQSQCNAVSSGSASATGSATESQSASASGSSAPVVPTVSTGTGGVPTQSKNQTASATSGATGTTKAPTSSQGGSGSATRSGTGSVPTTTGAAAAGPVVGALAAVLAAALAL